MAYETLVFRVHAVRRMFERGVAESDVRLVLNTGETIQEYPDDTPYPSRLVLAHVAGRPLHVVAADNDTAHETIVITVYEPDPNIWQPDFRRKQQ